MIGTVGWGDRTKRRVLITSRKLFTCEDVGCSSHLASAAVSTTMSSLLTLWFVAFVMHPAEANSNYCSLMQCNDLEVRLDTLNSNVNNLEQSAKQQQEVQQKQHNLIQEHQMQLSTLNKTAEKQQQLLQHLLATHKEIKRKQQQQKSDVATLTHTVGQQKKLYQELQGQLTKQEKTLEEHEEGMR